MERVLDEYECAGQAKAVPQMFDTRRHSLQLHGEVMCVTKQLAQMVGAVQTSASNYIA